jgi:hypothetical protein
MFPVERPGGNSSTAPAHDMQLISPLSPLSQLSPLSHFYPSPARPAFVTRLLPSLTRDPGALWDTYVSRPSDAACAEMEKILATFCEVWERRAFPCYADWDARGAFPCNADWDTRGAFPCYPCAAVALSYKHSAKHETIEKVVHFF